LLLLGNKKAWRGGGRVNNQIGILKKTKLYKEKKDIGPEWMPHAGKPEFKS